jgi:hypothetical protein
MKSVKRVVVNFRFYALFAILMLVLFPLHEGAHYLAYRAIGVHLHMTLNTASPKDQLLRRPFPEFAGPLLNLALGIFALLILRFSDKAHVFWSATALAASLMRVVIYLLILGVAVKTGSGLSMGNDEPIAAHMWGLPSLTFVCLLSVLFIYIIGAVVDTWAGSRLSKALNLFGLALVTFGIGILIGNVLDPWLFPKR